MSYHKIELFGHIVYSPDLSYDDLLAREEAAKEAVQAALENVGGNKSEAARRLGITRKTLLSKLQGGPVWK